MPASPKPTFPWKLRLMTTFFSLLINASCRSNGTVNRRLFNLFDRKHPPNPNPVDGVTTSDVTVDPTRNLWVIGLVSIEPFFGGEERTESEIRITQDPLTSLEKTDWYWEAFLPNGLGRDHEAVNVSGPNAVDISGLGYPNTLVVVAGFDPLQDWQRRYYEWLRKSGKEARIIEYPNMIHGFHLFPDLRDTSGFVSDVKDFITKQVASCENIICLSFVA
ncbi:carboxylesterase 18 [Spatholobus suberectus]|nr:carboxylesterase 18 [Spatholobus suberectus]